MLTEDQKKAYLAKFPDDRAEETRSVRTRALDIALDNRKFEIDLYWRRATYFWTLNGAAFAGYFLLKSKEGSPPGGVGPFLLVSCLGLVLSLAWFLVKRGSKYWQENWERHVDLLEATVIGPLQETTLRRQTLQRWDPWGGPYPYSVTKISQAVSLFATLVWAGILANVIPWWYIPGLHRDWDADGIADLKGDKQFR